jgi:hypothetical protein
MKRLLKNQGAFFGAMLMAAVVVLSAAPQARAAAEQDRLKDMVREVLRDNPGLVMDVLRQNPEQVLDIVTVTELPETEPCVPSGRPI